MGEENDHSLKPYERPSGKVRSTVNRSSPAYKQTYRKAWEELPDFKGWLAGDPEGNKSRAYCKVCSKTLHAHRISLLKHTVSLKHTRAFQSYAASSTSNSVVYPSNSIQNFVDAAHVVELQSDSDGDFIDVSLNTNSSAGLDKESSSNKDITDSDSMNIEEVVAMPTNSFVISNSDQESILIQKEMAADVVESTSPQIDVAPATAQQSPITSHVLDLTRGLPVGNLSVSLYQLVEGRWTHISDDVTNGDGRATSLLLKPKELKPGRYKLHFDTERYYAIRNVNPLYPFIEITFDVRSPQEHYHIPLLMTGFGYTTYRGS